MTKGAKAHSIQKNSKGSEKRKLISKESTENERMLYELTRRYLRQCLVFIWR